ncbi:Sec-independent protein translocase protein TatB [Aurantiacibacter marinus]|uniref:Sec-independent protein translocase protein TatB n=1 Tax=Aurantiacibacter marinus TaxID=874156 RepID=A0A0H0XQL4_9SPHN|nr:hypothetical protein AAV99_00875 [Aurantiacibacter marinus]
MFDIGATELLLLIVVAILVIGPKDMPLALRTVGKWVGKFRKMSAQFRTGFDNIVREAELDEMEQKWKAQNEKIMREHPGGVSAEMEPTGAYPSNLPPEKAAEIRKLAAQGDEQAIIAVKEEQAIIAAKEAAAAVDPAPEAAGNAPAATAESKLAASEGDANAEPKAPPGPAKEA